VCRVWGWFELGSNGNEVGVKGIIHPDYGLVGMQADSMRQCFENESTTIQYTDVLFETSTRRQY